MNILASGNQPNAMSVRIQALRCFSTESEVDDDIGMLFLSSKRYLAYRLWPTAWLRFDLHHLGRCLVCRVEPTTSWRSRLSVVESNIEGHMVFEIDI